MQSRRQALPFVFVPLDAVDILQGQIRFTARTTEALSWLVILQILDIWTRISIVCSQNDCKKRKRAQSGIVAGGAGQVDIWISAEHFESC